MAKRISILLERLSRNNISEEQFREKLPDWWNDEIAETEIGFIRTAFIAARHFNLDLCSLINDVLWEGK